MSGGIEARIAEVLRTHWHLGKDEWVCVACGEDFHTTPRPEDHLAAVLVKELGLKQERRELAATVNGEITKYATRYVTDWSRDE